jgi:hypothetical protein
MKSEAMSKLYRRVLGPVTGVLAQALYACKGHQSAPTGTASLKSLRVDSGVRVVALLPRDTIDASDQAPVILDYYVVNGPKATQFDNDPLSYTFRVETFEGREIRAVERNGPASGSYGETKLNLPARALLRQSINLRRIADGAGYGGLDPMKAASVCLTRYSLQDRGKYRIIVDYTGRELSWRQDTPVSSKAAADTSAVSHSVPNARHLSDTAILVVR